MVADGLCGALIVALGLRIAVACLADIPLALIISLTGHIGGTVCQISGGVPRLINQAFGRAPAPLSTSLRVGAITTRLVWSIGLHVWIRRKLFVSEFQLLRRWSQ